VWDGIFSEHTFEHLYPLEVFNLVKELKRTMKPGAWIRITVPDLKKYVNYYCGKQMHEEFLRWASGCEAIRSLTQSYGHKSVWDSELLKYVLKELGFINIKEVSFMQGTDKFLLIERKERQWETLYMEAQKPSI
jgi:predicted SAM-dependent methyltransferase